MAVTTTTKLTRVTRTTKAEAAASGTTMRIGEAARRSGVPAKTIRFYEDEGVAPRPPRDASGYRAYGPNDVRRLRLLGRLRSLGLSLDEAGGVAAQAFGGECRAYVHDLSALLHRRCDEIDRRVAELLALRSELGSLAERASTAERTAPAGLRVEDCGECPVVDDGPEPVASAQRCDPIRANGLTQAEERTMDPTTDRLGQARTADLADVRAMMGVDDSHVSEALDALACDIGARPAGAPHFLHVRDALLSVHRDSDALMIDYDPAAASTLERVVDAERTCCAELDWRLERVAPDDQFGGASGGVLRLRIGGTPEQLDAMHLLFADRPEAVEVGGGR
ncbi:MAG: hypothetical protein AVDCRST_MAG77-3053 [uncultured Chloroflexi bacterium]|uniref:HTH merR-type domain-containing protein n=1 Tax=uncultured Chloroflexota bacterium TaxID=166587 RepID=A0A6J4J6Z7_9CHLR|nr:MAG: hypothetical protein AVDCRST_MAG77-3053 [uncultured Chloroflexota bacterium]